MAKMYTQGLRVQALLERSNSPTSRCLEAVDWIICVGLQRVLTLVLEEGVAYIECARTPAPLHYKGTNVHKVEALLVTPALSTLNSHED